MPLNQLAAELGVHLRTLQAAARTGRLEARFSERSVWGRPRRFASRAVVYQWESGKRTPSPVFWQRVQTLEASRETPRVR